MIDRVTLSDLEREASSWDAAVRATEGIDPWCTNSDWVIPAARSFDDEQVHVWRGEQGWALFRELPPGPAGTEDPPWVGPDPVWGFACPIVAPDDELHELIVAIDQAPWPILVISGLVEGGPHWQRVLRSGTAREWRLGRSPGITRKLIDLAEGPDAWLERRSPRFRRNLRRAVSQAEKCGVDIQAHSVPAGSDAARQVFDRVVAIEETSWKGQQGSGILGEDVRAFYQKLLNHIGPSGRLRTHVATLDGRDIGYVIGAVRDGRYRGFQLSFDDAHRQLSVGNLLQWAEIQRLAAEGVHTYDLGMDMEYKQRWADHDLITVNLVAFRT
ncbi:MAG: GNAT family N-acetyltransferase [Actinomycetia bacterium]|nr:GNAT family N-acetyltransferase [Actinomycetes bacterium]